MPNEETEIYRGYRIMCYRDKRLNPSYEDMKCFYFTKYSDGKIIDNGQKFNDFDMMLRTAKHKVDDIINETKEIEEWEWEFTEEAPEEWTDRCPSEIYSHCGSKCPEWEACPFGWENPDDELCPCGWEFRDELSKGRD